MIRNHLLDPESSPAKARGVEDSFDQGSGFEQDPW